MSIEIKTPSLPESIEDATVSTWYKKEGDAVKKDETIVDLETDKVVLEVPAAADGVLKRIAQPEGAVVKPDDILGVIEEGAVAEMTPETKETKPAETEKPTTEKTPASDGAANASPAVRQLMSENNMAASQVTPTGKGGMITKEDVEKVLAGNPQPTATPTADSDSLSIRGGSRAEKRVAMTRMRARIADRLLSVKQNTAMLTTFNEVNMKPVMDLREQYKEKFEKTHDVKLGFMSFFTKASVEALKRFPAVNASLDGNDLVYHGYCDVGIAVSSDKGLVVPVLRNAENMSMAEIESHIRSYAVKARSNKLTLEEMQGGTFTITNGGVFGSMLSTPILNAPQSAILGMHNIVERPFVEKGEIVIRPIMYLALSYDHRVIDGKDSVSFLRTIKEFLEDPARMLLDV